MLIDTGGLDFNPKTSLEKSLFEQIEISLTEATHVLFVVDGRTGLTPLDLEIGKFLKKRNKPVFVVVNKIDDPKLENNTLDFVALGFDPIFPVSAAHNRGIEELLRFIFTTDSIETEQKDLKLPASSPTRIAVIGQPNAGKSTLINGLIGEKRLVVDEHPGTTHDAVDVDFSIAGVPFTLIDTAGLRKKNKLQPGLESKIAGRTVHAINRSHIVLFVIDAEKGISLQDKKIGGLIQKAFRPCIIVLNKIDLLENSFDRRNWGTESRLLIQRELPFLSYAPVVALSAEKKWNYQSLFTAILLVDQERKKCIPTHEVAEFFQRTLHQFPPQPIQGKRLKIYYATQLKDKDSSKVPPCPTFVLFVNNLKLLKAAYKKFLEGKLRQTFAFTGCPILWKWKKAQGKKPFLIQK